MLKRVAVLRLPNRFTALTVEGHLLPFGQCCFYEPAGAARKDRTVDHASPFIAGLSSDLPRCFDTHEAAVVQHAAGEVSRLGPLGLQIDRDEIVGIEIDLIRSQRDLLDPEQLVPEAKCEFLCHSIVECCRKVADKRQVLVAIREIPQHGINRRCGRAEVFRNQLTRLRKPGEQSCTAVRHKCQSIAHNLIADGIVAVPSAVITDQVVFRFDMI